MFYIFRTLRDYKEEALKFSVFAKGNIKCFQMREEAFSYAREHRGNLYEWGKRIMFDEQKIQKFIEPIKHDSEAFVDVLNDVKIDCEETCEIFDEIAGEAHKQEKKLELERTKITKPLLEAKRAVDALFKPALTACKEAKASAKGKIAAWRFECERARVAALQTGEYKKAELIPLEPSKKTAVTMRKVWAWKIINFDLIPREFLMLDVSNMKIAIQNAAAPENLNIPGIEIYQDETPVMGR